MRMANEGLKPAPEEQENNPILPKFKDGIETLKEEHKCHKVIIENISEIYTQTEPIRIWVDEKVVDNLFQNYQSEKNDFHTNEVTHALTFVRKTTWNKEGGIEACDGIAEVNGKKLFTRIISVYGRTFVLNPNPTAPKLQ